MLENTSVPHPNFTRCMAGEQPRHSTSCCRREGGEAHPLARASLLSVLAVKSKHKHSRVKSAQLEGQPSAQPSARGNLQTRSSLCKTKGKEREPEKGRSVTPGAFAVPFLPTLCHPCPLRGPELKRQKRASCNRMFWRPSSKTLIR